MVNSNRTPAVENAFFEESGHEALPNFGGDVLVPVGKAFRPYGQHGLGVGDEDVGQYSGPGFTLGSGHQRKMYGHGVGQRGDVDDDAFFLAFSEVETFHQPVHGRVGLRSVHMPEGEPHRGIGVEGGITTGGQRQAETYQQEKKSKASYSHPCPRAEERNCLFIYIN